MRSSGIPASWAAGPGRPGINYLADCEGEHVDRLLAAVAAGRREADRLLVSVHWGGNWGYDVPAEHVAFAHRLVDEGGVDIVHGHSSHHPMAVEVYRGRLIIYGCGDLLNDYEGIRGHEAFRSELTALYFPVMDARSGELRELSICPMEIRRLRLGRCSEDDVRWMAERLDEQSRRFGVGVEVRGERLFLDW